MSEEAAKIEVEVEDADDDEQVSATADELFISEGEFYTTDAVAFFQATGAIGALVVAGDLILIKPDGKAYKVGLAEQFSPDKPGGPTRLTRVK